MIHILRFRVLFLFVFLLSACTQQEFLPAGTGNNIWTPALRFQTVLQ